MEPLLQVKNIAKEFPGVKALEDISIDFYPGECHALVGENGAGKSTLIKIIASIYKPTRGEVILDGKVCNFKTPKDALDAGIAVISFVRWQSVCRIHDRSGSFLSRTGCDNSCIYYPGYKDTRGYR